MLNLNANLLSSIESQQTSASTLINEYLNYNSGCSPLIKEDGDI